jgi:hypothetical protein
MDAEVTGDGGTWPSPVVRAFAAIPAARKELHFQDPLRTPLEDKPGAATASFIHLAAFLRRLRDFAAYGSLAAGRGLATMDRTPGGSKGNPGKRRAQLLARLLLSIATRYAPAATTRPGDPASAAEAVACRGAIARFVHALTLDAGLPTVSVKRLEAMLREPGARWATPAEVAARQGTDSPP